uniref:Branchpoint-bridging protein n=1 Tax=Panagrolaimus sp. JU765 TaxID=591449 RepID=A0AC34Q5E1_9BILA
MNIRSSGGNSEPLGYLRSFPPPSSSESKSESRGKHKEKKSKRDRERSRSNDRYEKKRSKSRSRERDSKKKRRRRSKSRSRSPRSKPSRRESSHEKSSKYDYEKSDKYNDYEKSEKYEEAEQSYGNYSYEEIKPVVEHTEDFPRNVVANVSLLQQQHDDAMGNPNASLDPIQQAKLEAEAREQRRRSRWSTNKAFVPGMPTILPSDLDDTKTQIYLLTIEIEEATRKLRLNEFALTTAATERSPSPEPIYDNTGKRLNTREVRKRQELEQRRHEKILLLKALNPDYKPPADYRPPNIRLHEKVWIPQDDHPEINFVGLLIGPRGNTLKSLEQETGARIIIRGKGSVKEGKLLRRDGPMPGENEPLHAYVTGNDIAIIKKACERIQGILDDALNRPDANNMLRQHQLRELAVLNGTLRPEDVLGGTRCSNCGSDQHKTYECTEQQNVTANIICSNCGSAGHISKDCLAPRTGYHAANNEELDNEYSALMAEIGTATGAPKMQSTPAFKLPPVQSHTISYTRPPVRQFQQPSNQYYATQPSHLLPPPPAWPMPETLDPTAAAAAVAAMAASNGGSWMAPGDAWLPPPPPPPET